MANALKTLGIQQIITAAFNNPWAVGAAVVGAGVVTGVVLSHNETTGQASTGVQTNTLVPKSSKVEKEDAISIMTHLVVGNVSPFFAIGSLAGNRTAKKIEAGISGLVNPILFGERAVSILTDKDIDDQTTKALSPYLESDKLQTVRAAIGEALQRAAI
jgi:hypothetical protein